MDDIVLLRVPDVDRGPVDPPNLICKVLSIEHGLYKLACEAGVLNRHFARNDVYLPKISNYI